MRSADAMRSCMTWAAGARPAWITGHVMRTFSVRTKEAAYAWNPGRIVKGECVEHRPTLDMIAAHALESRNTAQPKDSARTTALVVNAARHRRRDLAAVHALER